MLPEVTETALAVLCGGRWCSASLSYSCPRYQTFTLYGRLCKLFRPFICFIVAMSQSHCGITGFTLLVGIEVKNTAKTATPVSACEKCCRVQGMLSKQVEVNAVALVRAGAE